MLFWVVSSVPSRLLSSPFRINPLRTPQSSYIAQWEKDGKNAKLCLTLFRINSPVSSYRRSCEVLRVQQSEGAGCTVYTLSRQKVVRNGSRSSHWFARFALHVVFAYLHHLRRRRQLVGRSATQFQESHIRWSLVQPHYRHE
jgi:hypothetical protein